MPADIDDMTVMRVVVRNGVSIDLTGCSWTTCAAAVTFLDALPGPIPKAEEREGGVPPLSGARSEPEPPGCVLLSMNLVAVVANLNLVVADARAPVDRRTHPMKFLRQDRRRHRRSLRRHSSGC